MSGLPFVMGACSVTPEARESGSSHLGDKRGVYGFGRVRSSRFRGVCVWSGVCVTSEFDAWNAMSGDVGRK